MRVLIAGVSGFVGGNLALTLIKSASVERVFGLQRAPSGYQILEISATGSRVVAESTMGGIGSQFKDLGVSSVVNLAANTSKSRSLNDLHELVDANITFASALALESEQAGVDRYIFASTYSTSLTGSGYEPQTLYAATKKAAEDVLYFVAQTGAMSVIALDFYDIYGKDQPHTRLIPTLMKALLTGEDIHLSPGEQEFCPLHVSDACEAVMHALSLELKSSFIHRSVAGSQVFRVKDVAEIVATASGGKLTSERVFYDQPYRAREIMKHKPQHALIEGWTAKMKFEEGLKQMIRGEHDGLV